MSSSERSRGKEASDDRLFSDPAMQTKIRNAVRDLSFLLGHGYAEKSSLQLVGNRYRLNVRQQKAVNGMAASPEQVAKRHVKELNTIEGKEIAIDGFNLLIILESALSGAYVFKGPDGCYRDISSVHGTYKRVQQTERALHLVGQALSDLHAGPAIWYFDSPVSNSGRLKTFMREVSDEYGYAWEIDLVHNPDKELAISHKVVVSSDAWVLDQADIWFNLAGYILDHQIPDALVLPADSPETA